MSEDDVEEDRFENKEELPKLSYLPPKTNMYNPDRTMASTVADLHT